MAKLSISKMFRRAFSSIFTKPATNMYPFIDPQLPENSRGQLNFNVTLCVGCGLCQRDCPSKAIEMVDYLGKKRPQFKLEKCLFCYQCAETCRKAAIKSSTFFEMATTDKSSLVIKPEPFCIIPISKR